MTHRIARVFAATVVLGAVAVVAGAQSRPLVAPAAAGIYKRLLPQIERIRIFDHHAHPGVADDDLIDPAPVPPGTPPLRLRPENPDWVAAAKALFGYPYADFAGAHGKWLADRKAQLRRQGPPAAYFSGILDRLGIETSVANRIAMNDTLDPARFRWVFYADAFMFPFDNSVLAARNPDQAAFMPAQTKQLQRFEQQAGLRARPSSFADYLAFVTRVLDENRRRGAIAVKFEAAYFRSLSFDDPSRDAAGAIYERYHAGGVLPSADYRTFQDFMFRHIVTESGRLHLAVHIHSSVGAGDYFSVSGGNPLRLESVLKDPRYLRTTFVLVHGGYPFEREAIWLAAMRNVYLDSSATGSFLLYPDAFKQVLRQWLETYPDKITFGSDAFPTDETLGAEEVYWMAVHNARTALAAALAEMVAAGELSEARAIELARDYLHDTAARLYASPARPSR